MKTAQKSPRIDASQETVQTHIGMSKKPAMAKIDGEKPLSAAVIKRNAKKLAKTQKIDYLRDGEPSSFSSRRKRGPKAKRSRHAGLHDSDRVDQKHAAHVAGSHRHYQKIKLHLRCDDCDVPVWNGTYIDLFLQDVEAILAGKDISENLEDDYTRAAPSKLIKHYTGGELSADLDQDDEEKPMTYHQRYYREKIGTEKNRATHRAWRERNREHIREYDRKRRERIAAAGALI